MEKTYRVIRINEPDFGCEGCPDGEVMMDKVLLEDADGKEIIVEADDHLLYLRDINEDDLVILDEKKGILKKG